MKHLLLIILTFLIIGCSGSDDNNSVKGANNLINPPSWIQGTWFSDFDGVNTGIGLKITSDNFCTVLQTSQNCWKELVEASAGQVIITEDISDTEYKISMTGAGSSITIHLRKVSPTKIETVTSTGLNTTYNKQ